MSAAALTLPLPEADARSVGRLAEDLAQVAAQLTETVVARAARDAFGLSRTWSGPAADAARAEAQAVTAVVEPLGATLARAWPALGAYAAALDSAAAAIRGLQAEWVTGQARWRVARHTLDAAADVGSLAAAQARAHLAEGEWAQLQRELATRHTRAVAPLADAATVATAALRQVLAVLPGGPDLHGALLARLPMTAAAERRAEAERWLAGLVAATGRPVDRWRVADLGALSAADLGDPERARALMAAMAPGELERLTAELSVTLATPHGLEPGQPADPAAGRLDALALAFVTALDSRSDAGLDEASAAAAESARSRWIGRLLDYGAGAAGGGGLTGFDAQGVLLRIGARVAPERVPGPGYAARAAAGMVAAERARAAAPPWILPRALGGPVPLDLRADPLADLLERLHGDPASARAALLASTGDGSTVAEYLLHERLLAAPGAHATAVGAVARLLPIAATGDDVDAVRLSTVVLDAAGATAQATLATPWLALSLDRELAPLRGPLADLLCAHPETWDAWNLSAAAQARLRDVPAVDLVGGHPPDRALVILRSPERFDALLGELARDGLPGGEPVGPAGGAPALTRLLDRVVADGSDRLVAALAPPDGSAPDLTAARATARTMGQVVGTAVAAGTIAVVSASGARDQANTGINEVLDYAVGKAHVPGAVGAALSGSGWGWAVSLAESQLQAQAQALLDDTFPTDSAERARSAGAAQESDLLTDLRAVGDAAVVRARAWQPQDAPSAWCARRPGCTPFWGPDGQPLPAAQLSPPALTSAEAWRTAVVSTGDVPDALVLGAEEAINRLRPPQR